MQSHLQSEDYNYSYKQHFNSEQMRFSNILLIRLWLFYV